MMQVRSRCRRGGGDPSLRHPERHRYYIEATDGDIGHVDDFIVDTAGAPLHADRRNRWPG